MGKNREAHSSTHMSFLAVRTCIGVLRELESDEAMTLSFVRREALLEAATTCLDKLSFFVITAAEWRTPSRRGSLCIRADLRGEGLGKAGGWHG